MDTLGIGITVISCSNMSIPVLTWTTLCMYVVRVLLLDGRRSKINVLLLKW